MIIEFIVECILIIINYVVFVYILQGYPEEFQSNTQPTSSFTNYYLGK